MKFVDDSQNLRVRLRLIQVLVLLLLGVLCVRLYLLQIVNGSRYAEIAENQRIRLLPIPARRIARSRSIGRVRANERKLTTRRVTASRVGRSR